MRNCLGRSKLELHGPRSDIKIGPQSHGGMRSAPLFVQMRKLPTKRAAGRAGGASPGGSGDGARREDS
eukprot:281865-Alexandrium_andersonii.AAC.1